MFYEVKTIGLNEKGDEVKELWLVECDNAYDALNISCARANTTEVESLKRSSIYEVINEGDVDKEHSYIIEFAFVEYNEKGKEKELKYKLFLYADDFDEAKSIANNYLKQGYDGFKLNGLNESKIVEYIKELPNKTL